MENSTLKLLSFETAIQESAKYSKRHLLLGNGFSISCRPDIFHYDKLVEQADFATIPLGRQAFDTLGTSDFERVIRSLRVAAALSDLYSKDHNATRTMLADADNLRELLVQTLSHNHPTQPSDISDTEYRSCKTFLSHFDTTYTLNYDLLLYWSHMHCDGGEEVQSDDGFRTSQTDIDMEIESEYVVWEPSQSHDQNMWFLHGALHIFDSGTEIRKYTWKRTGIRLIDQIRNALSNNSFPLFVAEGSSDEKYEKIRHSDYLAKAYRSFQQIKNCIFIYGYSLSENDDHFLRLIEKGSIEHIYIGLYGDPGSLENIRIIQRSNAMSLARNMVSRKGRKELKVDFYDSESAHVWR